MIEMKFSNSNLKTSFISNIKKNLMHFFTFKSRPKQPDQTNGCCSVLVSSSEVCIVDISEEKVV